MIRKTLIIPEDYSEPPYTEENKEYFKRNFEYVVNKINREIIEICDSLNIDVIDGLEGEIRYVVENNSSQLYFTAWSKDYILVRGTYDGNSWIEVIPRNPSDKLCKEIGGG